MYIWHIKLPTSESHSETYHGIEMEKHFPVGGLGDGPEVGRDLVTSLAEVHLDHLGGVDGEPLVRVDHHTEQARVGVDQLGLVASLQVPEDGGLVEEGQVSHVLALLKLRRIDLAEILRFEDLFLY